MESLDLQTTEDGVFLKVRAAPGSRQDELRGVTNGCLRVAVTQVAEQGKANKALVRLLAKATGLRKSQIRLVAGATSRDKTFHISEVAPDELRSTISATLAAGRTAN